MKPFPGQAGTVGYKAQAGFTRKRAPFVLVTQYKQTGGNVPAYPSGLPDQRRVRHVVHPLRRPPPTQEPVQREQTAIVALSSPVDLPSARLGQLRIRTVSCWYSRLGHTTVDEERIKHSATARAGAKNRFLLF